MRGRRWLLLGAIGLEACLLDGCCLRATLPPETRKPPSNVSAPAPANAGNETKPPDPPESNYLVCQNPIVQLDVQPPTTAEKTVDKPVEPVEMRIQSEETSPPPLADSPEPRPEARPAPLPRPDAPSVQVLRALHEQHGEEEINEQVKSYDPPTRELMLVLLESVTQLEQVGGIARIAPRDLAVWTDRLNTMTASLRGRAQLMLGRMCFCSYIKNFGDFAPLPPEHTFFQPGEVVHVYVEVRNFSCRRQEDRYLTVLKGRLEIYDENTRAQPPITWVSRPREDASATPRQDYYINFRFQVPLTCPAGLHTMRIAVEDWTDAPAGAKQIPESRIAQRTLDFRVGGSVARPRVAEVVTDP